MSRSEYLMPVYAVERGERAGMPIYEPRSDALLTDGMPRLWSSVHAAKNAASEESRFVKTPGTVVPFRLVTPEEYDLLRQVQRDQEVDMRERGEVRDELPLRERMRFEAAKAAMKGLLASENEGFCMGSPPKLADFAVEHADALLAALESEEKEESDAE